MVCRAPWPSRRPGHRGFSLVEVLVVVLVMTFGLLGIAALQANTAKFRVGAWVRSTASVQFADLADRLRANPGLAGGSIVASDGTTTAASAYVFTENWAAQQVDPPQPRIDCLSVTCTPAEWAAFDVAIWRAEVRRQFPQGSVHLEGDVGAGGVRATIAWFDRTATSAAGEPLPAARCPAPGSRPDPAVLANCCPAPLAAPGVACARVVIVP